MRLLITGAGGMLAQDVHGASLAAGHEAVTLARAELDVTDRDATHETIARSRPDVVVNCAAFTNVDLAERCAEAYEVNRDGAANVASAALAAGAWTIHLSTDYVFNGAKREPYVESDPVGPLSAYGRSKLEGELAVARGAPEQHTIVRSSWLYGAGGPCFPATILRVGAEREELSVVDDQVGCPTFTGHLAPALIELAKSRPPGLVHLAGGGHCSWYQLARELVREAGIACEVTPGRTADLRRPAPRPRWSVLGTERGRELPRLPDWRTGLTEYLGAAVASR